MKTITAFPGIKTLFLVIALLFQTGCVKGDFPMPTHPGGKIYNGVKRRDVRCFHCHGLRGNGTSHGPALLQSGKTISPREFMSAVVHGRGEMPSFKSVLSEKDILLIADWLEKVAALKDES
ncbi:MAG: cytochrome c [Nitrospira sp.]